MAVPKLRFKEFDRDLTESKLVELTLWASGGTPAKDIPEYWGDDIPLISGASMHTNQLYESDVKITRLGLQKGSKLAPKDSILILVRGSMLFNKIPMGITLGDVAFNQDVKCIRPKQELAPQFLFQWLHAKENTIQNKVTATGIGAGKLDTADLQNLKLYKPSSEEQTKIASFLSNVDEKISQLTQKHELLSQYKQGMMQKLFSQQIRFKADDGSEFGEWKETKFLNLMEDLWDYRGKTPKKLGMDWGNGEIQSLSALNIKKGFIDFDADCHLGSEDLYKVWMNKGDLVKDDIIFTMEAPLGNVALVPDDRKYILSQRVVCFKTNKKCVFNPFLFQLILSDQFQNRIDELATGTTAKGINQKSMQKIDVKIPSLEEQTKIANFLSTIDQKIEVVAQQIEQAKQWKKGLLQQMFV
ncbi:restriction endonuclease subunit S [Acinetobacter sp. YH12108]|uniref:restriction endonuclease subunit S n=1 Tax=Acinetobacter sp. YH12108 TaxID=2601095 RepID=UPI0015D27375|nr:restriction endonuclease subunit S [Acinetobacter sp. YH12108]